MNTGNHAIASQDRVAAAKAAAMQKPVVDWDKADVLAWLEAAGFAHYRSKFAHHRYSVSKLSHACVQFVAVHWVGCHILLFELMCCSSCSSHLADKLASAI
jgi:hypothetical protein